MQKQNTLVKEEHLEKQNLDLKEPYTLYAGENTAVQRDKTLLEPTQPVKNLKTCEDEN